MITIAVQKFPLVLASRQYSNGSIEKINCVAEETEGPFMKYWRSILFWVKNRSLEAGRDSAEEIEKPFRTQK